MEPMTPVATTTRRCLRCSHTMQPGEMCKQPTCLYRARRRDTRVGATILARLGADLIAMDDARFWRLKAKGADIEVVRRATR
jgi:hypothetical protein